MTSVHWCLAASVLGLWLAAAAEGGGPRISLEEFGVEPTTLRLGEAFVLRARATATGVKLGSFLLRTADEVPKDKPLPGFPLYANGKYYVAEADRYFLMDNGPHDRDPREGAFAIEVSTKGWSQGRHELSFFASCRPHRGPFVAARHNLAVAVKGHRVSIEDLGEGPMNRSRAIGGFAVEPATVTPGQPLRLSLRLRGESSRGLHLTTPYPIAQAESLPGFAYDPAQKKAFLPKPPALITDNGELDRDPAAGRIALEIDTRGWPPGVHHLLLHAVGHSGRPTDHRAFALKVPDPRDRLEVSVEPSVRLGDGTHFSKFLKLRDGTLLYGSRLSRDGGRTWEGSTGGFGVGGTQLRDGTALGLDYRCIPIEGRDGWYRVAKHVSTDNGRRFAKTHAEVHVPEAKAAMGHGWHVGPLFMRSIVERGDGSLVALMAGWFKSDTALCPYGRGRPYSRTYAGESTDGGQTWRYLTTIGYDQIGSEGYNEGSMRRLPNGHWLAVMRTGSNSDLKCQDNPIMWSVSTDEGRTWTKPQRTGLEGAFPSLAVLRDGLLAIGYGRPGAMLAFSADGGRTWTDRTCVDATPYSGYTDVVEVAKGELLFGFGARDFLDPKTGERTNDLRLARIRYRKAGR